ncbi:hypothetical protein JCM9279_001305 [Rhodotorula babjevae]
MSALDRALLREDLQAPVSLGDLPELSPAQLAVASLRPDLHALVRQRAHIDFLELRTRYRSSSRRNSQEEPLLDSPLDFTLHDSLLDLSATQLLLVQFNPYCKSPQIAESARLFLQRASQVHGECDVAQAPPRVRHLSVERCKLVRQGMSRQTAGELALKVMDEALVVSRDGSALVKVLAEDITSFKYLTTPIDGAAGNFACTLKLAALHVELDSVEAVSDTVLEVVLGDLGATNALFLQLRATVEKWTRSQGFAVEVVQQKPPTSSPSTSMKRARSPLLTPPSSRSPSSAAQPQVRPSSPSPPSSKRRRSDDLAHEDEATRSAASRRMEAEGRGPWKYVSSLPEVFDWHPGAFVRQLAFLQAIVPQADLARNFPSFSPDDIALLSRRALLSRLPELPRGVPEPAQGRKHDSSCRLALEHLYHSGPHLDLMATRLVLLTNEYPVLRQYCKLASKLIDARDTVRGAGHYVLNEVLPRRQARQDDATRDPVDELIPLVRKIYDNPLYRRSRLLDASNQLIRTVSPAFSEAELGPGIFGRFEKALADIVEFEERAGAVG